MKQSLLTIVKIALIALCAILLLVFIIPFPVLIPPEILNPKTHGNKDNVETEDIGDIKPGDPGYIAMLFGWVSPTPTPPPRITPVPTKTPVPTCNQPGYLKFVGTTVDSKNIKYYIIKENRYNYTFNIALGHTVQGYTLKKIQGNFLVLSYRGEEICIPIR
jgi:hypothetical protein